MHQFGGRLVLDQFQRLVAEHHGALGGGQVAADLEGALVHLAGHAAIADQIPGQVAEAVEQALAAGIQQALERGGVGQGVGRRQGVGEQADDELAAAEFLFGQTRAVEPLVHLAAPGQVDLHVAAEQRALRPGRIAEAAVAGFRLQLRTAQQDVLQLAAQGNRVAGAGERAGDRMAQQLLRGAEDVASLRADHGVEVEGVFRRLLRQKAFLLAHDRNLKAPHRLRGGAH
ncbi:hypothetical protein D9M69_319340 [compost metagenome]